MQRRLRWISLILVLFLAACEYQLVASPYRLAYIQVNPNDVAEVEAALREFAVSHDLEVKPPGFFRMGTWVFYMEGVDYSVTAENPVTRNNDVVVAINSVKSPIGDRVHDPITEAAWSELKRKLLASPVVSNWDEREPEH